MIKSSDPNSSKDKPLTKGERTRLQLLDVAAAEFAQRGFQHARVSDIVGRAGVTQPVFYQYFANKQAAYDELVGMFAQPLRHAIGQARLPNGLAWPELAACVRRGVSGLLRILQEDANLTRIGFFQSTAAEALKAELAAMIADNVRAEQRGGLFRPELPADWFAQALVGIVERFALQAAEPGQRVTQADFIVELLLDGMQKRPPQPAS